MAKRKRKGKKSKHSTQEQIQFDFDPTVPTFDYLEHLDLEDPGYVDQALDNLIDDIKTGYFVQWEAVMRQEQGLRLATKQKKMLGNLLYFGDSADEPILYIDELPRPSEPWYEIARNLVPRILHEPFRTDEGMWWAMHEGWPALVEVLETHVQDLSLPQGVESPLDLFPLDLRHRLWLQVCFDALSGLGQDEELTLKKQPYRTEWFVRCLREHKESVQYFDLTVESLLTRVILPPEDEERLMEMMTEQLGLTSPQDHLANYL
ncbi:MAG: hypothetical protein JXA14_25150 [Anaerolineae bacterium]|nr:hypothetical protein [Anaerolineae bacterium]